MLVTSQFVSLCLQLPFACACAFYKLKGGGKLRGVMLLFLGALSICQTIPVALGISLLIKSIHQISQILRRRWFFSKICLKKSLFHCQNDIRPWFSGPVLTFGKRL